MVRATLAGRKTMTRRLAGLREINETPEAWELHDLSLDPLLEDTRTGKPFVLRGLIATFEWVEGGVFRNIRCPYGQVGDGLWGRETFARNPARGEVFYGADYPASIPMRATKLFEGTGWKPSIHMPRTLCRIEREITAIRVERLQAITEEEVFLEGLMPPDAPRQGLLSPIRMFAELWDTLNPQQPFARNPWNWVLSFKPLAQPLETA